MSAFHVQTLSALLVAGLIFSLAVLGVYLYDCLIRSKDKQVSLPTGSGYILLLGAVWFTVGMLMLTVALL